MAEICATEGGSHDSSQEGERNAAEAASSLSLQSSENNSGALTSFQKAP